MKREIGSVESQFCASFFNSRRAVPIQAPLMRGGAVGKSESRAFQRRAVGPLRPNARGALKLVIGLVKGWAHVCARNSNPVNDTSGSIRINQYFGDKNPLRVC